MSDLIPGCGGSSNDTTPYLPQYRAVDVAGLSAEPLSTISVGVNWELAAGSSADLDLGCLMVDARNNLVDLVNYQQLRSKCGAVRHGGDSRGDAGDGRDDELLSVHLDLLSDEVRYIAFYLSSYKGGPMADVVSCGAHLYETDSRRDLALLDCYDPDMSRRPSALLCILVKAKSRWHFMNLSAMSSETSVASNIKHVQSFIPACVPIQNLFAYAVRDLSCGGEFTVDTSYLHSLGLTVECGGDGVQDGDRFGASVVMFDRQGKFIDGVDARRVRSRRGPLVTYESTGGREEFVLNLTDPLQDNVFVYFIVLNGRTDSSDLSKLGHIRVELLDGEVHKPMCRYVAKSRSVGKSILLARVTKVIGQQKVGCSYMYV
jgi:tellurium resistance protein TerZ